MKIKLSGFTLIESILAVIFGGIFWGAIDTYIAKKWGELSEN